MARKRLTQLAVDQLKPQAERFTVWDGFLPGFGLRVSPKGKKSWIAAYRVRRKFVIETLGSMALFPKVDDARDLARESMRKARQGINPVDERRAVKEQEAAKPTTTFKAVYERYLRERVATVQKAGTAKETNRIFELDILPFFAKRDIADIKEADVRRLIDRISDRGGSLIVANVALLRLRTFCRWALKQKHIKEDPTALIERLVKPVERERVLTDEEIVKFWAAAEAVGFPFEAPLKLLLLTAQRRDEVGEMVRSEVNLDTGLWTIPGARTKNELTHDVHLAEPALDILQALPMIGNSPLFFTTSGKPLNAWGTTKSALDKLMGVSDWRIHDLRRTATTGMARLKIRSEVTDKILNHTSGKGNSSTEKIYNRYSYSEERKSALATWARYVLELLQPGGADNVVHLAKREGV